MKNLLNILFILILTACSKEASTHSSFQLFLGSMTNQVSTIGGSYVEIFDRKSNKINLIKLDSNNSTDIPYGDYDLVIVAFSGPNDREGVVLCGLKKAVKVDGTELSINVSMNPANCAQDAYTRAILEINKGTKAIWNKSFWDRSYWGS